MVLHHRGYSYRARLGVFGARTAEESVHALVKQTEPQLKLPVPHWKAAREFTMYGQRVAPETGNAEEDTFPEVVHLRQMPRPVRVGDVVENRAQEIVVAHAFVETVDEALDVCA